MAVITYRCPNCGAEIKFDPTLQKGKCDFCMSEFTVADIEHLNNGNNVNTNTNTDTNSGVNNNQNNNINMFQ